MKVFVTGASGFIGTAVVKELLDNGHQVLGLVRSDSSAEALASTGAEVQRGSLEDIESLKSGAAASDGVIHLAFIHDFTDFHANCEKDRIAIEAMGSVLEGSDRPLLTTSGVAFLTSGRLATENDAAPPVSATYPRASEAAAFELAARGVKASVVRLSPSVHGEGEHGFVPMLIDVARAKGVSAYIGDGLNRWPGVHRFDAAHLYRLALEAGSGGVRYHGVADEGVPTRQIAELIGKHLNLPVVSISPEEAGAHFGFFMGMVFGLDCAASSALTQERLGWKPVHPGLVADIEQGHYFRA